VFEVTSPYGDVFQVRAAEEERWTFATSASPSTPKYRTVWYGESGDLIALWPEHRLTLPASIARLLVQGNVTLPAPSATNLVRVYVAEFRSDGYSGSRSPGPTFGQLAQSEIMRYGLGSELVGSKAVRALT
jgi:hypothetical protein